MTPPPLHYQPSPTDDDLLPIVNEKDEPIGVMPRRQVHLENRLHRAVHVGVFDSDGRIWLQRRAITKDSWAGAWDLSATGHVDPDESYDHAAVRELAEELGIDARPAFITKFEACEETGWEFQALYALRYDGKIKDYNRKEIMRMRLYTVDAIELILDGGDPRVTFAPSIARSLGFLTHAMPERARADHPKPGRRP
ncbi:NUDIX domain-containing protein [bacterium]|nr:NUDIX domain-containing protein [bacterium]